MSVTLENAANWKYGTVLIGGLNAANPVGGADFSADWEDVGLLDGANGFVRKAAMQSKDFYAWGGILVATSHNQFKLTIDFMAYELDNPTVMELLFSIAGVVFSADNTYAGELGQPDLSRKFKIAFQTQDDRGIKRLISKAYAKVEARGDVKEGEDDLAGVMVTVTIYPDNNKILFDVYRGPALGSSLTSITVSPAAETLSLSGANSAQLGVTAHYADGTTVDVTEVAQYSVTTGPTKAAVDLEGVITGLTAGAAVITATLGTQSATTAITVNA